MPIQQLLLLCSNFLSNTYFSSIFSGLSQYCSPLLLCKSQKCLFLFLTLFFNHFIVLFKKNSMMVECVDWAIFGKILLSQSLQPSTLSDLSLCGLSLESTEYTLYRIWIVVLPSWEIVFHVRLQFWVHCCAYSTDCKIHHFHSFHIASVFHAGMYLFYNLWFILLDLPYTFKTPACQNQEIYLVQ